MPKIEIDIITIDGPSGVGKGTLAKRLAAHFNYHLLDSGALYRLVALASMNHGIETDNTDGLVAISGNLDVNFDWSSNQMKIFLEAEDVTAAIRTEEVASTASKIAVIPRVREALLRRQRDFAQQPGLVADGRDMGTVVFPIAKKKIFLTASIDVRANRRYQELKLKGISVSIDEIFRDIAERDERDKNRTNAPLIAAKDAHCIDTSELSIDEVFNKVLSLTKA